MGSNPSTVYWMDIFHIGIIVVKIVMFFKKTKINEKEAEDVPFKKYNLLTN